MVGLSRRDQKEPRQDHVVDESRRLSNFPRLFDVIYDQSAEIFSLICPLWCVSLYLVHTYLSMCVGFFLQGRTRKPRKAFG